MSTGTCVLNTVENWDATQLLNGRDSYSVCFKWFSSLRKNYICWRFYSLNDFPLFYDFPNFLIFAMNKSSFLYYWFISYSQVTHPQICMTVAEYCPFYSCSTRLRTAYCQSAMRIESKRIRIEGKKSGRERIGGSRKDWGVVGGGGKPPAPESWLLLCCVVF